MQSQDNYRLVVRRGPQPNQSFELTKDVMSLGRDIANDLVINDREISRHHLRITRGGDGHAIEDLGSTNGTFVNGKRVTGVTPLKNGDIIGLGETVTLVFELARGPLGAPMDTMPGPTSQPPPAESAEPASPYQPPRPGAPSGQPYQQPGQPYQQPGAPYQPPGQPYQQPGQPYQQPGQYGQPEPGYPPGQYGQPEPGYPPGQYGQPPEQGFYGYDYDPYAMREEEGGGAGRWFLFGCVGLLLFSCCGMVLFLVVVDATNSWCTTPIVRDVVQALGLTACPPF